MRRCYQRRRQLPDGPLSRVTFKDPFAIKFPKDWWGLIVRPDLGSLLEQEGLLQKNLFSARGMR